MTYLWSILAAILLAITTGVLGMVLLGDDGRLSLILGIILGAGIILIDIHITPEAKANKNALGI